ncbi:MAG: hypothetical protein AB7S99_15660 [Pseudodonghicola sp.]
MSIREELELEKLRAEISKISAETQKCFSEIRKLERERALYPLVVGSGFILGLVGLLKVLP